MEKLTKREPALVNGKQIVLCENQEKDCNDSCMYGRCKWCEKALQKLKDYEDLEEQGLLLKLHFGIGDVVYEVVEGADENYSVIARKCRTYALLCTLNEKVGKTIFLTKEEAEEALRKNASE